MKLDPLVAPLPLSNSTNFAWPIDEGAMVVVCVTMRGFALRAQTALPSTTRECPAFSQIVRATTLAPPAPGRASTCGD